MIQQELTNVIKWLGEEATPNEIVKFAINVKDKAQVSRSDHGAEIVTTFENNDIMFMENPLVSSIKKFCRRKAPATTL